MNQGLLLCSMVFFAASLLCFMVKSKVISRWQPTMPLLMAQFLNLGFVMNGANLIAREVSPAIGWLLIGTATLGSVLMIVRPGKMGTSGKVLRRAETDISV